MSAAIVALALHVGGIAFAVARMQTDEDSDSMGAPAIEIGLELASPRTEATDLPPGPETEASAACFRAPATGYRLSTRAHP